MPVLVVCFLSLIYCFRKKTNIYESVLVTCTFLFYCFVISSYNAFDLSGFGQRFFLPLIPFMFFPLFFIRFYEMNRLFRAVCMVLLVISVGNNVVGSAKLANFKYHTTWDNLFVYYQNFFDNTPRLTFFSQMIERLKSGVIPDSVYTCLMNYFIPLFIFVTISFCLIYFFIEMNLAGDTDLTRNSYQ